MRAKLSVHNDSVYMNYDDFKKKPGVYKNSTGGAIVVFEGCSTSSTLEFFTIFIRKDGQVSSMTFEPFEKYFRIESGKIELSW